MTRWYSVQQVAVKFKVTDVTVRNWIRGQYLIAEKEGARYFVSGENLAYFKKNFYPEIVKRRKRKC